MSARVTFVLEGIQTFGELLRWADRAQQAGGRRSMIREVVGLLVDTIRPRCVLCGRRRRACRLCSPVACRCPVRMLEVGGYAAGCPRHDTAATR